MRGFISNVLKQFTTALSIFLPLAAAPAAAQSTPDSQYNAAAYSTFRDMYAKARPDQNVVLAPIAVNLALLQFGIGVKGESAAAIQRYFNAPDKTVADITKDMLAIANSFANEGDKGAEVSIAGKIWIDKSAKPTQPYLSQYNTIFGFDPMANFNFSGSDAVDKINGEISRMTRGKIPTLVGSTHNVTFLSAGAVYFKAPWVLQFDPTKTSDGDFHASDGKTVKVKMMSLSYTDSNIGEFYKDERFTYASKSFNGDYKLGIYKPASGVQLKELVYNLQAISENTASRKMQEGALSLTMPRIAIDTQQDLTSILGSGALKPLFSQGNGSDFKGFIESPGRDQQAIIKTKFVLNEEGGEAAAAAAVLQTRSARMRPEFKLDSPAIIGIYSEKTGTSGRPLFLVALQNPEFKPK